MGKTRRVGRKYTRHTRRLRGGGGCFGFFCKKNKNAGAVEPQAAPAAAPAAVVNPLMQYRNPRALGAVGGAPAAPAVENAYTRQWQNAILQLQKAGSETVYGPPGTQPDPIHNLQELERNTAAELALLEAGGAGGLAPGEEVNMNALVREADAQVEADKARLAAENPHIAALQRMEAAMLRPLDGGQLQANAEREYERIQAMVAAERAGGRRRNRRSRRARRLGRKGTRRLRGGGGCLGWLCRGNKNAMAAVEVPGRPPQGTGPVVGSAPSVANAAPAAGATPEVFSVANPMLAATPARASGASGGAPAAEGVGPAAQSQNEAAIEQARAQIQNLDQSLERVKADLQAAKAKADERRAAGNTSGAALYDRRVQIFMKDARRIIQQKANYRSLIQTLETAQTLPARIREARGR